MTATANRFWLGTSWKMTKTLDEARAWVDDLVGADLSPVLQVFVLPAHTALATVRDRLGPQAGVLLGAQNAHWSAEGPPTGEVSMRMVRDAGASLVEIGHVERRIQFGETDDSVAAKVEAALVAGLLPLVCVGESLDARRRGDAVDVVTRQVRSALAGATRRRSTASPSTGRDVLIAYEPHWAVGEGGCPAAPADVAPVVAAIRHELGASLPAGASARVLYGGSVDAAGAEGLVVGTDVDGLFVGRAAWTASGLVDVATSCIRGLERRQAHAADPARSEWKEQ